MKASMTLEQVGYAILMLVGVAIIIWVLFGGVKPFNENVKATSDSFKSATSLCKLQSILGQGDMDNDGYANNCDICMGGKDDQDADNDGIPDACDANKDVKLAMKADIEKRANDLKTAGVAEKDAMRKALLAECESDYSHADEGKEICCTAKFWNGKTCGITT